MQRIYQGRVELRRMDLWSLRGGQGDGYLGQRKGRLVGNRREDRGGQSLEGCEDPCQWKGVTRYRIAGYVRRRGLQNEETWIAGRAEPELEAGGDLVHVQVARTRLMRSPAAWRLRAMGLYSCASSNLECHEETWLNFTRNQLQTNAAQRQAPD